jgi:hypothetical protein
MGADQGEKSILCLLTLCILLELYSLYPFPPQVRPHIVHTLVGGGGQHGGIQEDSMPWITAKSIRETLASWAITQFSQLFLTNLLGF